MHLEVRSEVTERLAALSDAPLAVSVDGASKTFRIPHQQFHTFKERALHPFRSRTYDAFNAMNDVSVGVRRGEFFGIVGRNGSGKSTLLKCIAGIYRLDEGSITVEGRLSPFIELGVGFNPDLAAEDNVVINAVMMGLSRAEARRRFADIIAFAELEEFVDLKLKNYSSGMGVRLGFAVATQVDAEVLLVDEVLAVGDASFQQKCFEVFHRLKDAGKTILFVTHDMGLVERFCDRAMLIERGNVLSIGHPHEIGLLYNQVNFGGLVHDAPAREAAQRPVEIRTCRFEFAGEPVSELPHGETFDIAFEMLFNERTENPVFGVSCATRPARPCSRQPRSGRYRRPVCSRPASRRPFAFSSTRGSAQAGTAPRPRWRARAAERHARPARGHGAVILSSTQPSGGLIDPPHRFDIERAGVSAG